MTPHGHLFLSHLGISCLEQLLMHLPSLFRSQSFCFTRRCFRMNHSLVILAVVAAVVCGQMDQQGGGQGGPGGRGGGGPGGRGGHGGRGGRGHHGPPPPPYLRNVTDDARREYFGIITNMNETITQQNQDILTWAQKYGVQVR